MNKLFLRIFFVFFLLFSLGCRSILNRVIPTNYDPSKENYKYTDNYKPIGNSYSDYLTVSTLSNDDVLDEEVIFPDKEEEISEETEDQIEIQVNNVPLPFPYPFTNVSFDFPITYNTKVSAWIKFFTTKGRKNFEKWLYRTSIYLPYVKSEFKKTGLPVDLSYLPLIESGFNPRARSRAWAVGMWQFMASTGKHYGLRIDHWIDERRDPIKSTDAAIQYLSTLYSIFGDWYLAIASYNAGENKILRAIKRYKTKDFWELSKHRFIRRETANYVPKFIAAILIAKSPESFGFNDVELSEPLTVKEIKLPMPMDLYLISELSGLTIDKLLTYNPELRHWVTPPNYPDYKLKLPLTYAEKFTVAIKNLDKNTVRKRYAVFMKKEREKTFVRYRLRWGETLSHIARRYHIPVRVLMRLNHIRSARRVRAGRRILIPLARGRSLKYYTKNMPKTTSTSHRLYHPRNSSNKSYYKTDYKHKEIYIVRNGDTLWDISTKFNVPISYIKKWNKKRSNFLRPGDKIVLYKIKRNKHNKPGLSKGNYVVQYGDSLWEISQKFNVSISDIKKWNKMKNNFIKPGDRLIIKKTASTGKNKKNKYSISASNGNYIKYRVRSGDTLWRISRKFDVSLSKLKRINNIRNNNIHPGDVIYISKE